MDADLAKHVTVTGFRSMSHLTNLLPLLRTHCDAAEADVYATAIGNVAAALSVELIGKVLESHPDVETDIDKKMKKYSKIL